MKTPAPQFQALISNLVRTLQEELRQNRRLLGVVRKRKAGAGSGGFSALDSVLRAEREMLTNTVLLERDRIALVTELGELLGHAQPSRLRVAEILLYAAAEDRDELLELRDELRDIADELEDLGAVDAAFARHRQGSIQIYVTPSRTEDVLGGLQGGAAREAVAAPAPGFSRRERARR
jgi:hypothetical protein